MSFTARKPSLGQGYIFTSMCQEFCSQGGAWSRGVPGPGGMPGPGEGPGPGGLMETLRDVYWCGWYASYWDAFLLKYVFIFSEIGLKMVALILLQERVENSFICNLFVYNAFPSTIGIIMNKLKPSFDAAV